jgi:hypothetical protein
MNGIASKTLIEMIWSLDKNMIPSTLEKWPMHQMMKSKSEYINYKNY